MKKLASLWLIFFSLFFSTNTIKAQINRSLFDFEYQGFSLNGVLNTPDGEAKGLVLFVHGAGCPNSVGTELFLDVRTLFVKAGYSTYMYDKMGCGNSEGTFDYNQSIDSSSDEAIAAIKALQESAVSGSDKIGLWGISRAGWINPMIISKYKDIMFWVSVSGVDDKENFNYLLGENLRIDGLPEDSVNLIVGELKKGVEITHSGGTYEEYLFATQNLRKNRFMNRFSDQNITQAQYEAYQKTFMNENLDDETGLQVYVDDFDNILSSIDIPVLALFGELDMNVDWRKTKAFYEQTLGRHSALTTKTFANCNHNMFISRTGGFFEFQDQNLPFTRCEGFLESMNSWLHEIDK